MDDKAQDTPPVHGHATIYWVVFLTVLALALRIPLLSRTVNSDEAFTFLNYADRSFEYLIANYQYPNNHLFHTLLVRAVTLLFGASPISLRLTALLAGVLLVPAVYLWTREAFDKLAGTTAALLVAVAPACIEFSTRGRGYTLLALLAVSWLTLMLTALRAPRNSSAMITGIGVLAALGFWTMPLMLYPFVLGNLIGIVVVLQEPATERAGRLMTIAKSSSRAVLMALLLYAPVIITKLLSSTGEPPVFPTLPWSAFAASLPEQLVSTTTLLRAGLPSWLTFMLTFAAAFALVRARPAYPGYCRGVIAAGVGLMALLVLLHTTTQPRFWFFLLPLFYQLAGAGVAMWLSRLRWHYAFGLQVVLGAVLVASSESPASNDDLIDAEPMARYLEQDLRPGDIVLPLRGAHLTLGYWFRILNIDLGYMPAYYEGHREIAKAAARRATRAFLIVDTTRYSAADVVQYYSLPHQGRLIERYKEGEMYLFERPFVTQANDAPPSAQ